MYDLLGGLTVVEVSSFVASPSAGLYLAQMGAEVIRVDQIGGGQDFRRWPVTAAQDSLSWENLNRAKRSVALELTKPEGRELLAQLCGAVGTLVTNLPATSFLAHDKLAARRADAGEKVLRQAAAAKVFATEMCGRVVDRCVQVYGGAGYLAEYEAERFFRDARVYRIYEGTTQILQLQIAKHMLREFAAGAGA